MNHSTRTAALLAVLILAGCVGSEGQRRVQEGNELLSSDQVDEALAAYKDAQIMEPDLADAETEIEDVVLTAPDVSRSEFDDQFKQEIGALTRTLTVYVSSNDRALLMSRVLNRQARLGEGTFDHRNPDQFEEAAGAWDLVDPGSEQVDLVDVTPVNRTRNFHNFSLETPEFFDDLYLRLVNADLPRSRLQYLYRVDDGRKYWVLTRGR